MCQADRQGFKITSFLGASLVSLAAKEAPSPSFSTTEYGDIERLSANSLTSVMC
jgi:hypothetical protein